MVKIVVVYFHQNKKRRSPREERCHSKSMMSTQANERLKIYTQDVPFRKNVEEKVQGKERGGTTRTDETRNRYERSR